MGWVEPVWKALYESLRYLLVRGEFASFWSGLLASVAALIIGVPVGLWINRRILLYGEKLKFEEDSKRLENALDLLRSAFEHNHSMLKHDLTTLGNQSAAFQTQLDVSTWETVKPNIVQNLDDQKLKVLLARHFLQLSEVITLSKLYLDYTAGSLCVLTSAVATRETLKAYLIVLENSLLVETVDIHTQITILLNPKIKTGLLHLTLSTARSFKKTLIRLKTNIFSSL